MCTRLTVLNTTPIAGCAVVTLPQLFPDLALTAFGHLFSQNQIAKEPAAAEYRNVAI
jgi:hypothetical protein